VGPTDTPSADTGDSRNRPTAPSVLVVTVTYNSADALQSFLDSVPAASVHPLRVVVAENNSAEAAQTRAIAERAGATFFGLTTNAGYGGGVAAAVARARADIDFDYLLVSNPDVVLGPGSIDALVAAAEECRKAGSVGPRILDEGGDIYPSARPLPSLRTGIGHAALGRVWRSNPWTKRYRSVSDSSERREVGWLSGACLLLRREAYDQVGGFDTSYFMYFEDVDLGGKLGRAGWRNVYIPDAVVTHSGAHSTSRNALRMEQMHHDSAYRYLSRRYSGWYLAPLRLALKCGLRLRLWWVSR
jgi:N-acetylglucosaminyl-diphospho-decaprenol L-rhamnosyltransferase